MIPNTIEEITKMSNELFQKNHELDTDAKLIFDNANEYMDRIEDENAAAALNNIVRFFIKREQILNNNIQMLWCIVNTNKLMEKSCSISTN
jgi:hypothetical protein